MSHTFIQQVNTALDETLDMYLFIGLPPGDSIFIGLWSTWTIGGEAPAAKVVLATVPAGSGLPANLGISRRPVPLGALPWRILQLQIIRQTDKARDPAGRGTLWEAIRMIMKPSFDRLEAPEARNDCNKKIFFDAQAQVHASRRMTVPEFLTACTIERVDDKEERIPQMPMETLTRAIIQYRLTRVPTVRGTKDASTDDMSDVFVCVERSLPKNSVLGQLLYRETGVVKESNLLSAVEEWRTWILVGPFQ